MKGKGSWEGRGRREKRGERELAEKGKESGWEDNERLDLVGVQIFAMYVFQQLSC